MEEKDLQQLFDAKRTTEANRRRQEELHRMMEASATPKRRLWPVWTASIAASIALILITMPLLFRQPDNTPLLIAQTDTIPLQPTHDTDTSIYVPTKPTAVHAAVSRRASTQPAIEQLAMAAPLVEPMEEPAPAVEEEPFVPTEEPVNNSPRIHRRTSTRMVNSKNVVTVNTEIHIPQDFLASLFGSETNAPVSVKTIEF